MFGFLKSKPKPQAIEGLTPHQAHDRARKGEFQLVDVREANEWAAGHVPGAVHAPLSNLRESLARLPAGKPLVFYCLSGKRSASALAMCSQLGLPHKTHIEGGISAWRAAGLPVDN